MIFTSFEFILFLSILFVFYYLIPKKWQWILLLVANYIFYLYADVRYLIYILVTTISTFYFALTISRIKEREKIYLKDNKNVITKEEKKEIKNKNKLKQWKLLLICLVLNFGILGIIKYTNFIIQNINQYFKLELGFFKFVIPLGISYYTFMAMGYVIDVYRGKYKAQTNLPKFALFISFFPQLMQGPIGRYDDLSKTLYSCHEFDLKQISFGIQRVLWGYFKKLVVADRILIACKAIFGNPNEYTGLMVFIGLIFYSIDIYADFTGGIDITIGISEMLGIKLTENFDLPYSSKSIAEFWRRWHITMGTWFKDYIFYPISVCKPMLKISKWSRKKLGDTIGKRIPIYIATLIVWFLTGVWHGAAWNFIVWGLSNAIVILISQEFDPLYKKFHQKFNLEDKRWYQCFQMIRTFILVSFLRIFDCYGDVPVACRMFKTIFTQFNINVLFNGTLLNLGLSLQDYILLMFSIILIYTVSRIHQKTSVREMIYRQNDIVKFLIYYILVFCILIFGAYGIGYDASSFIYNQF